MSLPAPGVESLKLCCSCSMKSFRLFKYISEVISIVFIDAFPNFSPAFLQGLLDVLDLLDGVRTDLSLTNFLIAVLNEDGEDVDVVGSEGSKCLLPLLGGLIPQRWTKYSVRRLKKYEINFNIFGSSTDKTIQALI